MNSNISSRIAYVNGLVSGLEINKDSKEGKVLLEIIKILYDLSEKVSDLSEAQKHMHRHIDAVDEDLADLTDSILYDDYESLEDEENNFEEIKCPNCHDLVYVDKDMMGQKEEIICPNCKGKISLLLKKEDENK
ncbi:uncharacterized protein YbaR (Trm112 family) [Clostridium algifaecis]|uniref:Uncharacterized protein YbaR (Trm112 family) n=1 Tax=Clostridium algifaecis TaxID=1472040 RepID=A0ABS4KPQ7_9CLOT|nr:CD1247 N-terminal domain-containing protein [Clostridium algifaecis]MBP2031466.1 uncharacterized protein YbaR (Trm112 family) [Clostridium algifaecis]